MTTFKVGDNVTQISPSYFVEHNFCGKQTIAEIDCEGSIRFIGSELFNTSSRFKLVQAPVEKSMPIKTSEQRKAEPVYSGVLKYFPDAIAAVARVSKKGNDKHNPGEPMHWSRDKSSDHYDCAVRHMMSADTIDPDTGELHLAHAAWRILAALQLLEEAKGTSNRVKLSTTDCENIQ